MSSLHFFPNIQGGAHQKRSPCDVAEKQYGRSQVRDWCARRRSKGKCRCVYSALSEILPRRFPECRRPCRLPPRPQRVDRRDLAGLDLEKKRRCKESARQTKTLTTMKSARWPLPEQARW